MQDWRLVKHRRMHVLLFWSTELEAGAYGHALLLREPTNLSEGPGSAVVRFRRTSCRVSLTTDSLSRSQV